VRDAGGVDPQRDRCVGGTADQTKAMKIFYICGGALLIVFLVFVFCIMKAAAREVPPPPEEKE